MLQHHSRNFRGTIELLLRYYAHTLGKNKIPLMNKVYDFGLE